MVYTRGKMLFYTSDLPFPITQTPEIFSQFRKEVEKIVPIRDIFPSIEEKIYTVHDLDFGKIPTLKDLSYEEGNITNTKFIGGETLALAQVNDYIWNNQHIKDYKNTRNNMLGWEYSSKFSPWLSLGCLSPKLVYHEVRKFEEKVMANESTYWLIFELLWRDFFRLMGKKHGNKIFQQRGLNGKAVSTNYDYTLFNAWKSGKTGIPIIDANMKELNSTGFMSNRGRQLVASFLVKDLKLNWLMGAEYFESMLIDYDPCSNYCNWLYIAGLGNDPREDRYFNIFKQSKQYDEDGSYIKHWLPNLSSLSENEIHLPSEFAPMKANKTYMQPIVNVSKWLI
jgi:deoxyribodipyrimidine photo-lyase